MIPTLWTQINHALQNTMIGLIAVFTLLAARWQAITDAVSGVLDPSWFIQVPLVGAFIWFALKMIGIFTEAQKASSAQVLDFQRTQNDNLLLFMRETRDASNAALEKNAFALEKLADEVQRSNVLIASHDARVSLTSMEGGRRLGDIKTS